MPIYRKLFYFIDFVELFIKLNVLVISLPVNFSITIKYERRDYPMAVELVMKDELREQYRVFNTKNSIVLESNRPMLRRRGLKHKKPIWKTVSGVAKSDYVKELIIEALMKKIDK